MDAKKFDSRTPEIVRGALESAALIRPFADFAMRYDSHMAKRIANLGGTPSADIPAFGIAATQGFLLAHAAEVAIKIVLQQSGRLREKLENSHQLGALFEALPADVKTYADRQFKTKKKTQENLHRLLNEAGNASTFLRYLSAAGRKTDKVVRFDACESVAGSMLETIQRDGTIRVPS